MQVCCEGLCLVQVPGAPLSPQLRTSEAGEERRVLILLASDWDGAALSSQAECQLGSPAFSLGGCRPPPPCRRLVREELPRGGGRTVCLEVLPRLSVATSGPQGTPSSGHQACGDQCSSSASSAQGLSAGRVQGSRVSTGGARCPGTGGEVPGGWAWCDPVFLSFSFLSFSFLAFFLKLSFY